MSFFFCNHLKTVRKYKLGEVNSKEKTWKNKPQLPLLSEL